MTTQTTEALMAHSPVCPDVAEIVRAFLNDGWPDACQVRSLIDMTDNKADVRSQLIRTIANCVAWGYRDFRLKIKTEEDLNTFLQMRPSLVDKGFNVAIKRVNSTHMVAKLYVDFV